jgi:hypothetical protein
MRGDRLTLGTYAGSCGSCLLPPGDPGVLACRTSSAGIDGRHLSEDLNISEAPVVPGGRPCDRRDAMRLAAGRATDRQGRPGGPRRDTDSSPARLLPTSQGEAWLPVTEPLELLDTALRNEARLSPLGEVGAVTEIERCLRTQQRAWDHRGLAAPPPPQILVIGGLPRTGTTALHHAIVEVFDAVAPTAAEALDPQFAHDDVASRDTTTKELEARLALLQEVAPKVLEMHPMAVTGPDECTPILVSSLRCIQLMMMFHVPSYHEWYEQQDLGSTYDFWLRQISVIASGRRCPTPFVTKSPLHFPGYRELLDRLPQARIVHVRRGVVPWFESFLNVAFSARSIFSDRVDIEPFGLEWLNAFPRLLDVSAARFPHDDPRIFSMGFNRLAEQPTEPMEDLAAWLGWEPVVGGSRIGHEALRRVRSMHGSYRRLRLVDFGLTPQQVRRAFDAHLDGPFLEP